MRVHADWRSDLPRIVDNIPRRMPKRLAEFSDYAIHEASNWLFPKSSSLEANPDSAGFSNLSWPIWIALALLAATAYEAGRLTAGALRDIRVAQQGVDSLAEQQRRRQELRLRVRPMRKDLQAAIRKERARGVQWLFAVTLFTVWVSGIFDNATPLRP